MTADPQRLQYLEAMGIPAWVSRYRFTNAKATEQSEWVEPATREKPAPGQRLHALLDRTEPAEEARRRSDVSDATSADQANEVESTGAAPAPHGERTGRARALLGAEMGLEESRKPVAEAVAAPTCPEESAAEAAVTVEPLRFSLHLAVLDGRWWLLLPGERTLSKAGEALLQQMLAAAGMPARWQSLAHLRWPLMTTPTTDPEGEAREGIDVFCAGQARRNGLTIDGTIVVGNEAWTALVGNTASNMAFHRLPHPDELLGSVSAKRDSWMQLGAAGKRWRETASSANAER